MAKSPAPPKTARTLKTVATEEIISLWAAFGAANASQSFAKSVTKYIGKPQAKPAAMAKKPEVFIRRQIKMTSIWCLSQTRCSTAIDDETYVPADKQSA